MRGDDDISLQHLFNDAVARAREAIGRGEIEGELGDLLDKLTCLAATFLMYNQDAWFDRVIDILTQIYSMPLRGGEADTFLYSVQIDPRVEAPRVWLQVIERVYGLGALAVRQAKWKAVRELTLQLPKRLGDYDRNWLRHAITMTSRSGHLKEQQGEQTVEISLLILARNDAARSSAGSGHSNRQYVADPSRMQSRLSRLANSTQAVEGARSVSSSAPASASDARSTWRKPSIRSPPRVRECRHRRCCGDSGRTTSTAL